MTKSQDTSRKSQENGFERMETDKNGTLSTSPEGDAATRTRQRTGAAPKPRKRFSPEPWHGIMCKLVTGHIRIVIFDRDKNTVASLPYIQEETDPTGEKNEKNFANMRIIIAAPEMLKQINGTLTSLNMETSAALNICANCPWERKCKTCALNEVLRLILANEKRLMTVMEQATGN